MTRSRLIALSITAALIVAIVTVVQLQTSDFYGVVLGLCIFFFVCWIFFNPDLGRLITRPTVFIFVSVNSIRFILLPALIMICSLSGPVDNITSAGCTLFLYEEVVSCLFLNFIMRRVYKGFDAEGTSENELIRENTYLFYLIAVVLAVVAVILFPSLLTAYNFIFGSGSLYTSTRASSVIGGLWGVLYRIGFFLIPCVVSFLFFVLYKKTKLKSTAWLYIGVLLLFTMGFSEGTSRNSALIPAIAALFLLTRCFPRKKKAILVSVGVIIVVGFVIMSIRKFSYISLRSGRSFFTGLDETIETIEAYFSGPTNMSTAINAKNSFQSSYSIRTWFNDLFGNWPVISHYVDPHNRTTAFYNVAYYGRSFASDQIIPATGQGAFHFGYFFSVVPLCLFLYLSSFFDMKLQKSKDYVKSYIFAYASVRFAMILIANVSITSAFIGTPLIEVLLIMWISSKIRPISKPVS